MERHETPMQPGFAVIGRWHGPHAFEAETPRLERPRHRLGVDDEGVEVVVVEHVVVGHAPVFGIELGKDPEQQTAFLQVEVAARLDDAQVRRGQLHLEGDAPAVVGGAHVRASQRSGQRALPGGLLLNVAEVPVRPHALAQPVLHAPVQLALLRAVVLARVDLVLAQAACSDGGAVAGFVVMLEGELRLGRRPADVNRDAADGAPIERILFAHLRAHAHPQLHEFFIVAADDVPGRQVSAGLDVHDFLDGRVVDDEHGTRFRSLLSATPRWLNGLDQRAHVVSVAPDPTRHDASIPTRRASARMAWRSTSLPRSAVPMRVPVSAEFARSPNSSSA